jgi:hypothetical protein
MRPDRDNAGRKSSRRLFKEDTSTMQSFHRTRWLLALAVLASIVAVGCLVRARLDAWTRARLAAEQRARLVELPEAGAARLVVQLATDDDYLELVAHSLTDARPQVADSAEHGLTTMIDRWKSLPASDASPRVARLARELALASDELAPTRRRFTHTVAERLLWWPVEKQQIDGSRLIADCEAVLRLPLPVEVPYRVAVRPATPAMTAVEAEPVADESTAEVLPRVIDSQPPAPLIDANSEAAVEPRQFIAPRSLRISDDR